MPLAFFFSSVNITLDIQDLLKFHTNFSIVSSISVKNDIGVLIGIALNL